MLQTCHFQVKPMSFSFPDLFSTLYFFGRTCTLHTPYVDICTMYKCTQRKNWNWKVEVELNVERYFMDPLGNFLFVFLSSTPSKNSISDSNSNSDSDSDSNTCIDRQVLSVKCTLYIGLYMFYKNCVTLCNVQLYAIHYSPEPRLEYL